MERLLGLLTPQIGALTLTIALFIATPFLGWSLYKVTQSSRPGSDTYMSDMLAGGLLLLCLILCVGIGLFSMMATFYMWK